MTNLSYYPATTRETAESKKEVARLRLDRIGAHRAVQRYAEGKEDAEEIEALLVDVLDLAVDA